MRMMKMLNASIVPQEVQQVIDQFKQLDARLGEINKVVRETKAKMGYKEISDQLKTVKEQLYVYMVNTDQKTIGSISLQKCKPAAVKKEDRELKLTEKITGVLDAVLDEEQAAIATPVVVDAVLSK